MRARVASAARRRRSPVVKPGSRASQSARAHVPLPLPAPQHEFARVAVHERAEAPDRLETALPNALARAMAEPAMPLPHRAALERRFARSLGNVEARGGASSRAALASLGAEAASVGNVVFFADRRPSIGVVAHEVAHTLQAAGSPAVAGVVAPGALAEAEAARVGNEVATKPESAPVAVAERIGRGQVALQRADTLPASEGGLALLERPVEPPSPVVEPELPAAAAATTEVAEAPGGQRPAEGAPLAELEGASPAGPELPPAPEPGVTAEDVAAREAALAEAEAALAAATDAPALMGQFARIPPTLKARRQAQLGQDAAALAAQESQQFQEGLPEIHATMIGEAAPVEQLAVESPPAREVELEPTAPPPAPEPELPETPDPGHFSANADVTRVIDQLFGGAETADRAEQVGESLRDVSTRDPDLPRTPGPPPAVPLEGESDPTRLVDQEREAVGGARTARDEAQAAVVNGPGPERAQPVHVDESYAVDGLNQPTLAPVAPVDGAQAYLAMGMPPEVETAFDQQQHAAMEASMAGAVTQAEQAATERDQSRQAEVASTQEKAEALSRDADTEQRGHIADARATIQAERRATLDAQADAVTKLETDADTRRRADREKIDTRVRDDQGKIDARYQSAETDIAARVEKAEGDAREEKRKAEKAAEEESWWDRAVNFVRSAFNALVSAINAVFDAVRGAINTILDGVKAFALGLIDAVAGFIKDAIAGFGEFLKFAVNGLLGDIFPGLAAALNRKIDDAVGAAQGLVDRAANALKAGVAALVDGMKAGLNRVLDVFQAGLNTALALVEAALTGDWSALARKLLEAVLQVIGVSPESFYAFIGRAEETFQLILDNPTQFLRNVLDAVTGGVRRFAENIVTHLQTGIIGWLTGTLGGAGITLPERFDLMGVLSLAQQILGLTWERLRQKAVKLVGEANVARLEHVFSYIQTLVTEGWGGLWERIQADLGALRDQVLDGIKSFLMERVILAAITKIASLFNPVGAIVQIVLTAWNLFTFLRDQLQRIFQVVQAVVDAIGDIARGVLEPGMAKVEQVLASLLPLALDLLARLLGLGNVGAKVREIIGRIQATVDGAIDKLLQRVLAAFQGGRAATAEPATRQVRQEIPQADRADAPILETFTLLGEEHTIRSAGPPGEAAIEMASGPFAGLIKRINQLTKLIRRDFTNPNGSKYVGPANAPTVEEKLSSLATYAQNLVNAVARETNPRKERKQVRDGFQELVNRVTEIARLTEPAAEDATPGALTGLNRQVTTGVVHGYGTEAGAADALGRQTWFRVNPLNILARNKGKGAHGPVPGLKIIKGYDRGHLVAKRLGGPGTSDNLVPMSKQSNTARIGVVGVEESLRYLLYGYPTKYTDASPPYAFSYTVTARYHPLGGQSEMQAELERRNVAMKDSAKELFKLGAAATSQAPTDTEVLAKVKIPDDISARELASLPDNLRRRLAYYFLPLEIAADVRLVQWPTTHFERPYQSTVPAPNHLGIDKEWH